MARERTAISKLAESHERRQSTEEMLELTKEDLAAATERLQDTARQLHLKERELVALAKAHSDAQAMVAAQEGELRSLRSEVTNANPQIEKVRISKGDDDPLGDQAWLDEVEKSRLEQAAAAATVADAKGSIDSDAHAWAAELLDDCISAAVAVTST